jgi:hypothetical protein
LDIFSLGVIIIKIISGPTAYTQCAEMSSKEFIEIVRKVAQKRSIVHLPLYFLIHALHFLCSELTGTSKVGG